MTAMEVLLYLLLDVSRELEIRVLKNGNGWERLNFDGFDASSLEPLEQFTLQKDDFQDIEALFEGRRVYNFD